LNALAFLKNKREKPNGQKGGCDGHERRADCNGGASSNFGPVHRVLTKTFQIRVLAAQPPLTSPAPTPL